MFFDQKSALVQTNSCFPLYFLALFILGLMASGCKNNVAIKDESLEMDGMENAMRQEFFMTRDPALNTIPNERLRRALSYITTARTTQITKGIPRVILSSLPQSVGEFLKLPILLRPQQCGQ